MGQHQYLARQVSETISSFEHLVATDTLASVEDLGKTRLVLVQSVNAYIAYLDKIVALNAARPANRSEPWQDANARVVALRGRYSEHIGRYSAASIAEDWPGYRAGCLDLTVAMRAHLRDVMAWKPID